MPWMRFELAATPAAIGRARDIVMSHDGLPPERMEDAKLVVSELVTNALLYGRAPGGTIVLRLRRDRRSYRIEVRDGGDFTRSREDPRPPPSGLGLGLGLKIVEALCERLEARSGCVMATLAL